jgi:hypothetical protein
MTRSLAILAAVLALCATARASGPMMLLSIMDSGSQVAGLLARYEFVSDASDTSGYGNNGSLSNSAAVANGVLYTQSSGTNFVHIPDFAYPTNDFSAFIWVCATNTNNRWIFNHWNNVAGSYRSWGIAMANTAWTTTPKPDGNEFSVILSSNGGATQLKGYWVDESITGAWHHVGFTFDSGTLLLYLDGTAATLAESQRDAAMGGVYDSAYALGIGADSVDSGGRNPCYGAFDDARIYGRALEPNEVFQIYSEGR